MGNKNNFFTHSKAERIYHQQTCLKRNGRRRSQDGGVGRRGVSISPQLDCLPAAGGEL